MQDSPENTPSAPALQQPTSSGLARISLVLGILSGSSIFSLTSLILMEIFGGTQHLEWLPGVLICVGFCLGLLAGLPAIVAGHIARRRARKAPGQYGGAGFALAGIVMGYLGIFVAMMFLAAALPSLRRAGPTARNIACINNLKQIDGAKAQWALENRKRAGDPVVDEEVNAYLKNSQRPICPSGGVYIYNPVGVNPTCTRGADLGHTL